MSTTLVRFQLDSLIRWGVLEKGEVFPLSDSSPTLRDLLSAPSEEILEKRGKALPLGGVKLLGPITPPCQIICQGKNYLDHIKETGVRAEDKDYNLFFTKASSALTGPFGPVMRPPGVQLLDYEIELALVIGRPITGPVNFTEENFFDSVAGIVLVNDISARDIQVPQKQWYKGKSFRTFCPTGPYLCLLEREDFAQLSHLNITLKVNGEARQKGHTSCMIYPPVETLSELSRLNDLWPGDIVLTGTPGGVAFNMTQEWKKATAPLAEKEKMKNFVEEQKKSPRYLREGDVVEGSIISDDGTLDLGVQRFVIEG